MLPFVRVTKSFEPVADFKARYSDWAVIQTTMLPNGVTEQFFPADKAIFIDPSECGIEWAVAHITAHLDLGHHEDCPGDGFTDAQEEAASWLAAMRMDYRPEATLMQPRLRQKQLGDRALEDFDGPPSVAP